MSTEMLQEAPSDSTDNEWRDLLFTACRFWNVQTQFTNTDQVTVYAPEATLMRLLSVLSKREITDIASLRAVIFDARARRFRQVIEPVQVINSNQSSHVLSLYRQADSAQAKIRWYVHQEDGEITGGEAQLGGPGKLKSEWTARVGKELYVCQSLSIPIELAPGYHRLRVEVDGLERESLLMCVPSSNQLKNEESGEQSKKQSKKWGLFSPLYAIASRRNWGIGDLCDLEQAQEMACEVGASIFGTTPILPTIDASPYSPVSRVVNAETIIRSRKSSKIENT